MKFQVAVSRKIHHFNLSFKVAGLGCKSFALLFDDIEPELSLPDKQDFDSFGDAQVIITNQIYEDLGCPGIFLFCPTGKFSNMSAVACKIKLH